MSLVEVRVERRLPYELERVWSRYTDHESWTFWAGLGRVRLLQRGVDNRNGVGAVRRIENLGGLVAVDEEITAFEPPHLLGYRLLPGPHPIHEHEGQVRFERDGSGTHVVWSCRFRPGKPWLRAPTEAIVRRVFTQGLRNLERRALW